MATTLNYSALDKNAFEAKVKEITEHSVPFNTTKALPRMATEYKIKSFINVPYSNIGQADEKSFIGLLLQYRDGRSNKEVPVAWYELRQFKDSAGNIVAGLPIIPLDTQVDDLPALYDTIVNAQVKFHLAMTEVVSNKGNKYRHLCIIKD